MRLLQVLVPIGAAVAIEAVWRNVPTLSISTRFINKSPSVTTSHAVSWITSHQTSPVEDSDGWKVVSETPASTTDNSCGVTTVIVNNTQTTRSYCGVTTVTVDNPQTTAAANATRPDNYVVAQRLAHAANLYWDRFPTKPDNETDRCVNDTFVDDGTQGIIYNNSTVNCTALMLGHRWHAWECDHNCQERLAILVPAALARGIRGPLSNETRQALQRIARGQRSFMRLIRDYRRIAHNIHVEWQIETFGREFFMEQIRVETERLARRYELREQARARVRDRFAELARLPTILEEDETIETIGTEPYIFDLEITWYINEMMGTHAVIRAYNDIHYYPDPDDMYPIIEEEEPPEEEPPRDPHEEEEKENDEEEEEEHLPKILEEEIPEQPPEGLISPFEPRPEQLLYDSMMDVMEAPLRPGERNRPIRISEPIPEPKGPATPPVETVTETAPPKSIIPTSIPTQIPTSIHTSIPTSISIRTRIINNPTPSVVPSSNPSPVPINPPPSSSSSSNANGHMDISADGLMTLTGIGAWGLAQGFSALLRSKLSTCTPISTWTFMTRDSPEGRARNLARQNLDFLVEAKLGTWNGPGQDQCFNKMINEVGGPADIGYRNGMRNIHRPDPPKPQPQPQPKQEEIEEKPKEEKPKKELPKVNTDCCKCPRGWCFGWLGWHCCGY